MFRKRKHITFYYADKHLQIREIKWFRTKVIGFITGTIVFCLTLILTANYLYNNFLAIGNSRYEALVRENQILQGQLTVMTGRMKDIESSVNKLADRGNEMRLILDLPAIDEETGVAGTGGEMIEDEFTTNSDNTSLLLQSARQILGKLSGEIKLQQQSYKEIINQSEFNKSYFAALPAIKPMPGYYSRKEFGMRMHPVLGIMKAHEGLDIVNDVGTPVVSSGDGVIQMAGHAGGGFGFVVVVNHGYGYQTIYAHLLKIIVREGQRVRRGDVIAKSGKSGLVSGPHLHYEVRHNGVCQNPMDFFFDDISVEEYRKQIALR